MRIEISTPTSLVFEGEANSFEFCTESGMSVDIRPNEAQYLSLIRDGEIVLRVDHGSIAFMVQNASASFSRGLLTIIAASVTPSPPVPEQGED